MRRQQRSVGHAAEARGDVGAEPTARRHRAQRLRDRAVDLCGRDTERGDRVGTDAQFSDENIQRSLLCTRFGGTAARTYPPSSAHPKRHPDDSTGRDGADRQHHRERHAGHHRAGKHQ
jgi:hypothetical protein